MARYLRYITETNCTRTDETCPVISLLQSTERALGAEPQSVDAWQNHCEERKAAINSTQYSDEVIDAVKAMNTHCPVRIAQIMETMGVELEAQDAQA